MLENGHHSINLTYESPSAFTTPLRLSNTNNSCYANCIVQVLIHLNHFFSETVAREQYSDTTSFRTIYSKYLNDFKNNPSAMSTSESLRQYVARYPNQPINHSYLDNSMQDSFLFFYRFDKLMARDLARSIQTFTQL
jgi:ubiquitin C-terminal hydrolase